MKILLEIPDGKAKFFMEVLKNFSFIKKATPLSAVKADLMLDIRAAVEEINLIKTGKKTANNASDFLKKL
jgi:hypothetical protein